MQTQAGIISLPPGVPSDVTLFFFLFSFFNFVMPFPWEGHARNAVTNCNVYVRELTGVLGAFEEQVTLARSDAKVVIPIVTQG